MNVKITGPNGSSLFEADQVDYDKRTSSLRMSNAGVFGPDHFLEAGVTAYVTNASGETIARYEGRASGDNGPVEWPPLIPGRVSKLLCDDGQNFLCIGGFVRESGGATGIAIWPGGQIENRRTFHSFDAVEIAQAILAFANLGQASARFVEITDRIVDRDQPAVALKP